MTLAYIIIANIIVSLGALLGLVPLALGKKVQKVLLYLVALSAGTLLGDAFLHLLPEASEAMPIDEMFLLVLLSFIGFFIIERYLHWRHCHDEECHQHTFGTMNLIGDGVHNFIDGVIIAASFIVSPELGVITTFAVALHEIPQEIGDFGVLLHSGWSKKKALLANFAVACLSVIGGITGYILAGAAENFVVYLLPIAAGGFIYIGASDLLPEFRKETQSGRSIRSLLLFLIGVGAMYLLTFLE